MPNYSKKTMPKAKFKSVVVSSKNNKHIYGAFPLTKDGKLKAKTLLDDYEKKNKGEKLKMVYNR